MSSSLGIVETAESLLSPVFRGNGSCGTQGLHGASKFLFRARRPGTSPQAAYRQLNGRLDLVRAGLGANSEQFSYSALRYVFPVENDIGDVRKRPK